MFFQIEYLRRADAKKKCVVARQCKSAASLADIEDLAWAECRERGAEGFRIRDLHTAQVKVAWV
jgi:hypothetical protein